MCFEYNECNLYNKFTTNEQNNKAVFGVAYSGNICSIYVQKIKKIKIIMDEKT